MAYDQSMLRLVNTQFKRRAYKMYLYESDDSIADMSEDGYFEENPGVSFNSGDLIQAQASDGLAMLEVGQDVTTAALVVFGGGVETVNGIPGPDPVLDYGDFAGAEDIVLQNNVVLRGDDSGGDVKPLVRLSSDDIARVGSPDNVLRFTSSVVPQALYGGNTWDVITTEGGQTIDSTQSTRFGTQLGIGGPLSTSPADYGAADIKTLIGGAAVSRWYIDADILSGGWQWRLHNSGTGFANAMELTPDGSLKAMGAVTVGSYTTGTLPSAAANTGAIAFDTTLVAHVGSDGTAWNAMY